MASIQLVFFLGGGEFYPSQGGERSPMPEGPRAGSPEVGFLRKGSKPPPHQLDSLGYAVSSLSRVRAENLKFGAT